MKLIFLLFFIALSTYGFSQVADETAIKQLLEKESQTWRSGDIQGHADCWLIRPYSRIVVSTTDGNVIDVPPEMMTHPPANAVGKGGHSTNTNYKMNISGNTAWVSHDEESVTPDGVKSFTYEFRMLEKVNGEWKLVAQSIHAFLPK